MERKTKNLEQTPEQVLPQKSTEKTINEVIGNQGSLNHTGIPDGIKQRVEKISGVPMDDVKVHYNSPEPEKVQALAYAQGNQVYLAPGQELHLGHELGHVAQQKLGKVKPTGKVGGKPMNDDKVLERQADKFR